MGRRGRSFPMSLTQGCFTACLLIVSSNVNWSACVTERSKKLLMGSEQSLSNIKFRLNHCFATEILKYEGEPSFCVYHIDCDYYHYVSPFSCTGVTLETVRRLEKTVAVRAPPTQNIFHSWPPLHMNHRKHSSGLCASACSSRIPPVSS